MIVSDCLKCFSDVNNVKMYILWAHSEITQKLLRDHSEITLRSLRDNSENTQKSQINSVNRDPRTFFWDPKVFLRSQWFFWVFVNNFNNMLRLSMITTMTTVQSVPNNMKIAKIPPRAFTNQYLFFCFASSFTLDPCQLVGGWVEVYLIVSNDNPKGNPSLYSESIYYIHIYIAWLGSL